MLMETDVGTGEMSQALRLLTILAVMVTPFLPPVTSVIAQEPPRPRSIGSLRRPRQAQAPLPINPAV